MNFTVCYQHQDFIIIDKPAGISVHKDDQAEGLTQQLAKQLGVEQVWLVHRLDKVTSGLLILALNPTSASYFGELFAQHQIQKTYWALATAKPKKKQGKIIGDMAKSRNGSWKLCHSTENPAITHFHSISIAPHLRQFILQPKTGKTHQLRVAMKSLGSPILGATSFMVVKKPIEFIYTPISSIFITIHNLLAFVSYQAVSFGKNKTINNTHLAVHQRRILPQKVAPKR